VVRLLEPTSSLHPIQSTNSTFTAILPSAQQQPAVRHPAAGSPSSGRTRPSLDSNPTYNESEEAALFGPIFAHDPAPPQPAYFPLFAGNGGETTGGGNIFPLENGGAVLLGDREGGGLVSQEPGGGERGGGGGPEYASSRGDGAAMCMGNSGGGGSGGPASFSGCSTGSGPSFGGHQTYPSYQLSAGPAGQPQQQANIQHPEFAVLSSELINRVLDLPYVVKYLLLAFKISQLS
jgi:hypothetical protein